MGPLWDWMTHPFTRTPPGIASAPADLSSAAVGPSHAAAEAICVDCFKLGNSQWQTGSAAPFVLQHLAVICRPSDRIRCL